MTPREDGLAAPPEWRASGRYWLAWPGPSGRWGERLDDVRDSFVEFVKLLSDAGPVTILANPADVADVSLRFGPGVAAMAMPHSDCCMRIMGPAFLVDGDGTLAAGIEWTGDRSKDTVAREVLDHLNLRRFSAPPGLWGGSYDVDGEGTCLIAESALRDWNGDRQSLEKALSDYLGVDTVLWLDSGIEGDLSGGTISNVARFLKPGLVIAASEADAGDANFDILQRNVEALKTGRDAKGRKIEVIEVPLPKRRLRPDGSRIAMSYANCFVGPGAIVLPAFEDARDQTAYDRVVSALLDYTVASLPADDMAYGGGGFASMTLPQPSLRPEAKSSAGPASAGR